MKNTIKPLDFMPVSLAKGEAKRFSSTTYDAIYFFHPHTEHNILMCYVKGRKGWYIFRAVDGGEWIFNKSLIKTLRGVEQQISKTRQQWSKHYPNGVIR